ncbi:MAG: hypothetical protein MRY79_06415 [Alphaproteobacteria bacterium]|nr:hypothetical protein [Alphaproteobacteria bacterium]
MSVIAVSYDDIAKAQLEKSIDLYYEGDFICAYTLSAASAQILDGILKEAGQKTIFEDLRQSIAFQLNQSEKEVGDSLRFHRNALNHFTQDTENFSLNSLNTSVAISHGIYSYYQITQEMTPKMEKFKSVIAEHAEDL